jgi:glutathione S-transferase/nicotinamidase-related amidase
MSPVLIIIDLQNDFVSPDGRLKKKHIPLESLLPGLKSICSIFKSQQWPIIAIKSEYGTNLEDNVELDSTESTDGHLTGTHRGKRKFCTPGSVGAEFHVDAQALFDEFKAITCTKRMYSAFTDTALHADLQALDVGKGPIYFTGVTANNCVLASLTSAFQLGYNVCAIEDCIGATNPELKNLTLRKVRTNYGSVVAAANLTVEVIQAESLKPHRILYWVSGSIPSWRVMLALSLKQLKYTPKRLHVMTTPKETRSDEFLAINTRGKTPTLIDADGTTVIESMAILQYLEHYYPTKPLTPLMEQKAVYTLTLQRFHETENLHNAFEDIELLFLKDWARSDYKERIHDAYLRTINELKFWESYLSRANFVAGDEMSLADCAFYPNVAYLIHRGLDLEREGLSNLQRYVGEIGNMQCAKDALPAKWENPGKNLFLRIYEIVAELRNTSG